MRLKRFSVRCFKKKKTARVCSVWNGKKKHTAEESLKQSTAYDQTVQRLCISKLVVRTITLPYM